MTNPYSRQEVAYLVGPLLDEDPDQIQDVVIIAIVSDPVGEPRLRMRGPTYTPAIIGNLIADSLIARWEMRDNEPE
jgi:hypothetical protein